MRREMQLECTANFWDFRFEKLVICSIISVVVSIFLFQDCQDMPHNVQDIDKTHESLSLEDWCRENVIFRQYLFRGLQWTPYTEEYLETLTNSLISWQDDQIFGWFLLFYQIPHCSSKHKLIPSFFFVWHSEVKQLQREWSIVTLWSVWRIAEIQKKFELDSLQIAFFLETEKGFWTEKIYFNL